MQDSDARFYVVLAAGACLRLALFSYAPLVELASLRLELATPVTSWKSRRPLATCTHAHLLMTADHQSRKGSTFFAMASTLTRDQYTDRYRIVLRPLRPMLKQGRCRRLFCSHSLIYSANMAYLCFIQLQISVPLYA